RLLDALPDLLPDLPRARRLEALPRHRHGAHRLSRHPGHAPRPRRRRPLPGRRHGLPGLAPALRQAPPDRALDAPHLALRLGDGRLRLLDALPHDLVIELEGPPP